METSLGMDPKAQLAANLAMMFAAGKAKGKLSVKSEVNSLEDTAKALKEDGLEGKLEDLSNVESEGKGLANEIDDVKGVSEEGNALKDAAKDATDLKNTDESSIKAEAGKVDTVAKDAQEAGKIKDENIAKDVAEEEKNAQGAAGDIETVTKDKTEMNTVKDEAKDAVDSEAANITKAAEETGQAMKDENIAKDVVADAKTAEKATSKIVDVLKKNMNELFDHVSETFDKGKAILFKMIDGTEVLIEKAKLKALDISEAAINFCIVGCFTGDTLVLSKQGQVKIKDIKIGDYIYSQDVRTGEKGFKEVLQLQKRNTSEFVKVRVEDEEIQVTPSHLFYTNGQWELAGNLKAGDILTSANGEEKRVISVKNYLKKEPEAIYNFSVDEYHTYFVSKFGILVHNMGCSKITKLMEDAAKELPNFTVDELKTLRKNLKDSKKYTASMYRELMQGIIDGKYGLSKVNDEMKKVLELDDKAAYKFDVYTPKLDEEGNAIIENGKQVSDGTKVTAITDDQGFVTQFRHIVGDNEIQDRSKVTGYLNATTNPYDRGHIFSFREGLADNCIEDSPLNIIAQSEGVNRGQISQFEEYRSKKCKGMEVITDIDIKDPPGYVRVRVPEAGIDVRYNPLSKKSKDWGKGWFMPDNAGEIYD